jgi:hypothetical protein
LLNKKSLGAYLGIRLIYTTWKALKLSICIQNPENPQSDLYRSGFHRTRFQYQLFCGSLQEYLIKADGLHSNQEPLLNWFIHLVFFAFVEEKRTTKPVFSSVLDKWHLV